MQLTQCPVFSKLPTDVSAAPVGSPVNIGVEDSGSNTHSSPERYRRASRSSRYGAGRRDNLSRNLGSGSCDDIRHLLDTRRDCYRSW